MSSDPGCELRKVRPRQHAFGTHLSACCGAALAGRLRSQQKPLCGCFFTTTPSKWSYALRQGEATAQSRRSDLAASEDRVVEGDPHIQVARLAVESIHETPDKGARRIVLRSCQARVDKLGRATCVRTRSEHRTTPDKKLSAPLTCCREHRTLSDFFHEAPVDVP